MKFSNNHNTSFVSLSLLLLSAIATTTTQVFALPGGAGSCIGNGPAVGGLHLAADTIITGTLEEGNLTVLVNDIADGALETSFLASTEEEISVRLSTTTDSDSQQQPFQFKGFLIRLGAASNGDTIDYTSAMEAPEGDDSIQLSDLCDPENAAGLTHTSRDLKSEVTGTIILPAMTSDRRVMLDVTVVYSNADGVSEYYHSGYMLRVDGDGNGAFEEPEENTDGDEDENEDEDEEEDVNVNENENENTGGNDSSSSYSILSSLRGVTGILTTFTIAGAGACTMDFMMW